MSLNKRQFFLSPSEARIVAHVCGDGYLCLYKRKRSKSDLHAHPRKNVYRKVYLVGYCNLEKVLLDEFSADVKKVYNLKTSFQKGNNLRFENKSVFDRIKSLGGGKSRDWFISKNIINSNEKVICSWLRSFFDDEAFVELERKRICVNSVNKNGLKQVQELLGKVGISKTTFCGPYYYKGCTSYRLKVLRESLSYYKEKIGFLHPAKLSSLKSIILN
jgi:hypothetical protein